MSEFSTEGYDGAYIFLAYLAFSGNVTKVSIALKIPREVIEVLAAKDEWETKLDTYIGLRSEEPLSETDRAIRRTATHILACHLRDIIGRLIDYLHARSDETIVALLSPRSARNNRPQFSLRALGDLCRAFSLATKIINRTSLEKSERSEEEIAEKERLKVRRALDKVGWFADSLPDVDSVGLQSQSLAKWAKTDEGGQTP